MSKKENHRRWLRQGTLGILLIGSGLCLLIESGFYKHSQPEWWQWVSAGTGSLIVFMAGLCLFVDAIKYRIRYEIEKV